VLRAPAFACLLAALTVSALLGGRTSTANATFPGANGRIAFDTNRDGNYDVYAINPDGTGSTRLTTNTSNDAYAAWSPDGTKIAFASIRDGNFEIYTMNADGTNQTRLTNNTATDVNPVWSPDGAKLAFTTNRDGNNEIYTMNPDGTGPTRLTNNASVDDSASWSPDATKLAFATDRDGNNEIYTMSANGTNQTRRTSNAVFDEDPVWSPDGTKLVFRTNRDGPVQLYTMNADGTNPTRLTNSAGSDELPDWQPVYRNYARPRGATPTRISLTPAYKPCTAANTTHRTPLSFPSCNPPTAESSFLTVGTPPANGQAANSVGSVRFDVKPGPPEDISIDVSLTDVRCTGTSGGCTNGALADYSDDLLFDSAFRITDMGNGGANPSGTVNDLPVRFSVPCAPTVSTTVGSTCSISTTIDTLLGGSAVVAGQRAIWQMSDLVKLDDGGADGVASTQGDNTLFAVGGLFAP
jgi:tricorn protease-like protein